MRKYVLILMVFLFIQCNNDVKRIKSSDEIKMIAFVFGKDKKYNFNIMKTKIIENDSIKFIYEGEKKDTIVLVGNNLFFNRKKLEFIDSKKVIFKKKELEISKYYYLKNERYGSDFYIFFNQDLGLIFVENLNNGRMCAYDRPKLNEIHKKIAFKKINFKKGSFELIYPDLEIIEKNGFLN